jgi:acyl-CoA dehydrogenase
MTRSGAAGYDFDGSRPSSPFYNETHHALRESLRRFVDLEIMPHIDAWEAEGRLPLSLHQKAAEHGFLQMGFPEAYGGVRDGLDVFHSIVRTEELARCGAGGVSASLMTHGIGLPPILALGSDAMKQAIAPDVLAGRKIIALGITETSGGSDVAALTTKAERQGDYYLINGGKMFITSGMRADYLTCAVRTGGPGIGGISLLLIDMTSQGVTRQPLHKMGWHASDTAQIFFDDVKVPAQNLIGAENQGFAGIMLNFNGERLGMAAGANAFARVCLEDAALWARERRTFGKRLVDHQVIRHKLAEMLRQINATHSYLELTAWRVAQGETPVADLSMLKVQATTTMEFCAREAMQILGGNGYMRGSRIERIYREVRVNAIGGGSEEIMRDLAARQMGL